MTPRGPWDWEGHTVQVKKKGRSSAYEELFILVSQLYDSPNETMIHSPQHSYRYSTAISHTRNPVTRKRSLAEPESQRSQAKFRPPRRTRRRTRNPLQHTRTAPDEINRCQQQQQQKRMVMETCIPPDHEPRNLLQHRSSPKEAREMSTFLVAESLSEGTESEEYG